MLSDFRNVMLIGAILQSFATWILCLPTSGMDDLVPATTEDKVNV